MADQLYLSLWFPNFRLASLPGSLVSVMRQFAMIAQSDEKAPRQDGLLGRVAAATTYPIDWTEPPAYQRIYRHLEDFTVQDGDSASDTEASVIENAVTEATELLHEDSAYEFEMVWNLWHAARTPGPSGRSDASAWTLQPSRVRIAGFGPDFDTGSYEQNGHIRVDFGLDTPWLMESNSPEPQTASRVLTFAHKQVADKIRQNVEKLLAFTLSVEKNCGISSRLLWTESGEPLAEKLIAKLQRLN